MKYWCALQYSEEDIAILKRMFAEYQSYKDIGIALHRSKASILQKCHNLKLTRDHKMVRMVQLYGPEALAPDFDGRKALSRVSVRQQEYNRLRCARERGKTVLLAKLREDLAAGHNYTDALRDAHDGGLSIKQIAHTLKVTQWHVQSKLNTPKRVRERKSEGGW